MQDAPAEVFSSGVVLAGAAVTLGFAVAPLALGATDPLDPRRFRIVGLPSVRLAAILVVAGFISVPTLVLVIVAVFVGSAGVAQGTPPLGVVLGVVLGITTCILLARISMALTAVWARERRSRARGGVVMLVVGVIVLAASGVLLVVLQGRGRVPAPVAEAAQIFALTPLGAAWALPGGVFDAGSDRALTALAIAVATVAALAISWILLVRRLLSHIERPASLHAHGGLGWFALAPGTASGAVAARSLAYWLRDARYLVNIVVIPFVAALITVPLLVAGASPAIVVLVPVPVVALFLGWLPHNDLAYDSTAVWMHVTSSLRGVSDRVGRLIPVLLIGVPFLALLIPVAVLLHGSWMILPAMAGVSASLLLTGLGLSSVSSVLVPYAVSRPGESPFQQPQRVGSAGAISPSLVMLGAIVLSAPVLWLWCQAAMGDPHASTAALWAGLGTGITVLVLGILIGSVLFTRRGSQLMEFVEST